MDSSGTIKVAGVLDHETTDSYILTATASDGSLAGTATVDITVLDVNENPRFAQSTYPFTVREGSFSVGTVSASDPEGGSVTYSITAGDDDSIFSIGSSNGIIGVATLDYETSSSYSLTVTASDITGKTGMATVDITVEDLNEVSITGPAAAVTEGEDMTFTVSVENTTASALVVSYTLGGTAAFSTDYDYDSTHSCTQSGTTHCVTIPANSTSASIRFDTVSDTLTEAHETVVVELSSVSGGTDVGLDTAPSKRVATGEIVSPIEVPALDDNASSTVSVAVANGNTSTLRFDLSDLDAGRAYVVRMTALGRTAGSRDLVGAVSIEPGATAPPGFADIGGGQFVWVEGSSAPSPNERSVVVSFPREPTASSLEVTVSKPDLAFIGKPTAFVPMWGDTTGTVGLSMNIRNSSSTPSVDDESEIVVSCDTERSRYHSTRTHSFSSLRTSGTSLIEAGASEAITAIGSVCQGVALSSGTSEATADSFSFVVGVVVGDEVLHEVRLPHPDADYRWPFAVTDTLWHPQGTTTGGLQMIVMRPASIRTCTLSFPLRLSGAGTEHSAVSTTGHCTDMGQAWERGSYPLIGGPANVPLGTAQLVPTDTTCRILGSSGMETSTNCRRGDHAYAWGASPTTDLRIFRPTTENEDNDVDSPVIDYFTEHASQTFVIAGARPPDEDEEVHKVGRTTGWTRGRVENGNDPSCPGNSAGAGGHKVYADEAKTTVDYYIECLVLAVFAVDGGDSGSPVFVYKDSSTASPRKVLLVGVVYGRRGTSIGLFIPIERIYAESLMQGYDWLPETLRPVPVLDDPMRNEMLELAADGSAIVAMFDKRDLSQGRGLTYEAVLYRNGAQVTDGNGDVYSREVSRGTEDDSLVRTVSFELSPGPWPTSIPFAQRNGEFSVRVRLCPHVDSSDTAVATDAHCGGYGSAGDTSLTVPPAPGNLGVTRASDGLTTINWDAVESTTAYRVGYKVPTDAIWAELSDVTATSTAKTLSCFYDFRVRAKGDVSSYGGKWGFWSEPVTLPSSCSQGRSAQEEAGSPPPAPLGLSATSTASSVTLTWRAPDDSTVTGYRILRKKLGQSDLSVHVEDTASAKTSYVDTVDVEADATYVYRVKAINAAGAGAQSEYVRIATGRAQ